MCGLRVLVVSFVVALVGCGGRAAGSDATPDAGPPRVDGGPLPPPMDDAVALDEAARIDHLPAIAGGSLLVSADRVVATDPDRATLWVLDPTGPRVVGRIVVGGSDEPGRMVADGSGVVHVVLRGAGEVLDLDPSDATLLQRRAVCPAPRGIDWDPVREALLVTCAGGELMRLPAAAGDPALVQRLEPDLRDVVVGDGVIYVSRFRTAELLDLSPETFEVWRTRRAVPRLVGPAGRGFPMAAAVAWRLRRVPSGGVAMLHQRARTSAVAVEVSGYGSEDRSCRIGITAPAISVFSTGSAAICVEVLPDQPCPDRVASSVRGGGALQEAGLVVDFAVSEAGTLVHLAVAERDVGGAPPAHPAPYLFLAELDSVCPIPRDGGSDGGRSVIAVEALPDGRRVTVRRDPFEVVIEGGARFRGAPIEDALGHALFHAATESHVACASCHPEGHEDGHVWALGDGAAPRRTQSLLGGVLSTAPFHWSGDVPDLTSIMQTSFVERMGGRALSGAEVAAVGRWLDPLPSPPASSVDPDAEARGRALFHDATVGCAECHDGAPRADSVDVGTGAAFQVPRLAGVALRAPYLHGGCAPTLLDVLGDTCSATDAHGVTSHLDADGRADLVAYLRAL